MLVKKLNKLLKNTRFLMHKQTVPMRFFPNSLPDYSVDEESIGLEEGKLTDNVNDIITKIHRFFPANERNAEDGLYLGTVGVAYMFYHLSKLPAFNKQQHEYLSGASDYLLPALNVAAKAESKTKNLPSFLLGNGGIYAVAATIFHALKDKESSQVYRDKYLRVAPICKNKFLECGDDELFVGRAGYLCGALWMSKETDTALALPDLYDICNTMVASGRNYSQTNRSISPLMYAYYDTEYLGAAHGLCSILQMLMCVPGYMDAFPENADHIKASVDYLLELQTPNGNFPTATDEVNIRPRQEEHDLIHWCHGAPGVAYLMAKAYIVWGDVKYLRSCEQAADLVWERGLLRKGPGICHGVAGNGYIFLLLYRLTNDSKYLHHAAAFAEFINDEEFKQFARMPDNPYSLFEGLAGTACYFGDLTQPNNAVFPFCDIF